MHLDASPKAVTALKDDEETSAYSRAACDMSALTCHNNPHVKQPMVQEKLLPPQVLEKNIAPIIMSKQVMDFSVIVVHL